MKVTVVQSGMDKETVTLCYEIMSLIKFQKKTEKIKQIKPHCGKVPRLCNL